MGGKAKTGQNRTKNNARPSSSLRSAELLGNSVPAFVGFGGGEVIPVVPVGFSTLENEEFDSNLDNSYQLVLRKMTKKDSTTKTKALQEFTELVTRSSLDDVKLAIPFWPKLYANLSTDNEHRVRETAQQAQTAVITKLGKNIAPHLKQLIPTWICSQYDTYAPAASIASHCFQKAFPQNKINDVFVFCENEILEFFTKNLTVHTSQTICNPKAFTPEECENKYQRVLIASLRGYAMYFSKIPPEQLKLSSEKNLLLIDSPKFWSYHKNRCSHIRSAWFEAISAILEHGPFLLENHAQQVTVNVFQSIDDTDPMVLPHIWACLIQVQEKIGQWHTFVNMDKAVLPKLFKILKSGGAGNASVIFPHMLPLVAKFNKEVMEKERLHKFHSSFFESINIGLRTTQSSKSERSAISKAYYEVLQFVLMQLVADKDMDQEEMVAACSRLMDDHMIAVIFNCISTEPTAGKFVFHHIASLLNYWSTNSEEVELYQKLLDRFWSELFQVLKSSVELNQNIEQITSSHVELIQNLKSYAHSKAKSGKGSKVKFNEVVDQVDGDKVAVAEKVAPSFEQQLNQLVYNICDIYTDKTSETNNIEFVMSLEILVKEYQSMELFKHLAKQRKSENIGSLYDTFSAWLYVDELRCESIVEIILCLYKQLPPTAKIELLDKWIKIPIKSVQSWIILRALSHPLCMEPDITKLLTLNEVTDHLIDCARAVSNGVLKENLIILHKCFFQTESGDILIDTRTCERIVDIMCEPLNDPSKVNALDSCGSFLAQIMPVICSDEKKKHLQCKIFIIMFEFSLQKVISDDLSEDTLWEITTAWQDSLSSEDLNLDDQLLEACARIIETKLQATDLLTISIEGMENISDVVSKLILCSTECIQNVDQKMQKVDEILFKLVNNNLKDLQKEHLANLCCYIELLHGDLSAKSIKSDGDDQKLDEVLAHYLLHTLFTLNVILKLSCNVKKSLRQKIEVSPEDDEIDEEQEFGVANVSVADEEYTEDYCDMDENLLKTWTDEIYEQFLDVCYTDVMAAVMIYRSTNLNPQIETWLLYLQEKFQLCMKTLPDTILIELKTRLFALANIKGSLWAHSLLALLNTKQYNEDENGAILLLEDSTLSSHQEETILSYANILQVFSATVPNKNLPIEPNLFENYSNLLVKISATRSLIRNHFKGNFGEVNDQKILGNALIIIYEVITKHKSDPFLLYNKDISLESEENVLLVVEVANLLADVLRNFAVELDMSRFDFVRIALGSWVLSVSKSCDSFRQEKVAIFISSIFNLLSALNTFIISESQKSSTLMLHGVIEEWENVFAKDVNLVLVKTFMQIVQDGGDSEKLEYFLNAISPRVSSIDFKYVLQFNKVHSTISLNDLIQFALQNLSNKCHSVCCASASIIKGLTKGLIKQDSDLLIKRNSDGKNDDEDAENNWHILEQFRHILEDYNVMVEEDLQDFSFKINELDSLTKIPKKVATTYLLLWDCILNFCSQAPPELRSNYARWITENKFEGIYLVALFKLMPYEILKNPDTGTKSGQTIFSQYEWKQITSSSVSTEHYAAFLYTQTLRVLPAVVRKWYNGSNSRQAQSVDKITTNYVTPIICQEELSALITKREREKDNMNIKVHTQSRQVTATYSLEEAKMELLITLPVNHPLGAVKVESTKLIGGKLHARQVVMQLTIFLTHQNGSIWDGLSLWKKNLDRKFEGVEECYVCYSVIHQDTCQLPRLTCKTCKKKFHGPCLYRWFHTSNKSTCPICRNIF